MNKIISIIAIAIVIFGGYMLMKDKIATPAPLGETIGESALMPVFGTDTTGTTTSEVKEFTVDGTSFAFAPNTMTVNKGDTVKITFVNKVGFHDLVIDEFVGAKTKQLKAGESETITFVADKSGTFEYYCSVGSHRQQGMVGTLIVK